MMEGKPSVYSRTKSVWVVQRQPKITEKLSILNVPLPLFVPHFFFYVDARHPIR